MYILLILEFCVLRGGGLAVHILFKQKQEHDPTSNIWRHHFGLPSLVGQDFRIQSCSSIMNMQVHCNFLVNFRKNGSIFLLLVIIEFFDLI